MLKDRIINEIINRLIPLRTLYKEEIDHITNDLINDNYQSLYDFVDKYYQNEIISNQMQKLLNGNYSINTNQNTNLPTSIEEIYFTNQTAWLMGYKPLNLKTINFFNLKEKINKSSDTSPNQREDIKNESIDNKESVDTTKKEIDDVDLEYLALEETDFQKLKKSIINAQLNYLNNASDFIRNLEEKDADDIYRTLINLSNVSYIHHCISKLSDTTLKRFLDFMKIRIETNPTQIDLFIEKAIKLHLKPIKKMP